MKKVLILAGSPRKNGNSIALCREFERGAAENGNETELILLRDKNIGYCEACYNCKTHDGECVKKDDMADILRKMNGADVMVLGSPVYFYSVDARMKTLIDRTVARWLKIKNKKFYYIMTAAEDTPTVMDCALNCLRGLAACLEGCSEGGVIYGKGVYEAGSVREKPVMKEAYEMGKSI